jgi:stage II sporulation protein P
MTLETLYHYDYNAVPKGEIPILPMDLSLISYGASHINNATGLTPDIPTLLQSRLDEGSNWTTDAPVVLILHTHGTESYSDDGAISYRDDGSELARSDDIHQNVVSVGRVFAEELERLGIRTIHCMTMHDKNGYKDAYARAEETIRVYLEKYPSIRLVIDLHRDSIVSSEGNLIRPVTVVNGEAVAQVMCVVGSDWGGEENQRWRGNLSLALQLRSTLNESFGNICRPTYLKASTYNQEIAPYSLLLEIGASGNSLEEAQRAAIVVARSLAELIKNNK